MNKFVILTVLCFTAIIGGSVEPLWTRYPSISPDGEKVAFCYKGDLFVVSANGGAATQITSHPSHEMHPIWSPDGSQIAFSSDRYGNFDVFIVSSQGGVPSRLTYHSADDHPYDFYNQGKEVVFKSSRLDDVASAQFPYARLGEIYSVGVKGGRVRQFLTIAGERIQFDEDNKRMLFQDVKGYEDPWRKHHTSSVTRDILLYNSEDNSFRQITDFKGEDRNPIWGDSDALFFLSEKSGNFNVWSGDLERPYQNQLSFFEKNPVRFLSRSKNGTLCFWQGGEIYLLASGSKAPIKLKIEINRDQNVNPIALMNVNRAQQISLSPDGKEIAFIYRGDVFVTSRDYSTTKQITNTPEQERSVVFHPDGDRLAYASERNGSWDVYEAKRSRDEDKYFYNSTLIEERAITKDEAENFYPKYSPDGKELAFLSDRTTIKIMNLDKMKSRVALDGKHNYSYSDGDQYFAWSPDSKWIVCEFFEFDRWSTDIGLIDVVGKSAPINLTQSGYENGKPKFAMEGQMVYFSTNKYGYRSHGSWGAQEDVEAVFLSQEAYEKFLLNKEDFELWKEEEKESGQESKSRNALTILNREMILA